MSVLAFPAPALPPADATPPNTATVSVPLTTGGAARVDAADWPMVRAYRWRLGRNGYVYAETTGTYWLALHRLVVFGSAPASPRIQVHHLDNDPTNCTRGNLVACSPALNAVARRSVRGRVPYRGVTWNRALSKYQGGIKINGRSYHLGLFDDAMDAAVAYARRARATWGTWVWLQPDVLAELARRDAATSAEPSSPDSRRAAA